jgi:hypothetical protein
MANEIQVTESKSIEDSNLSDLVDADDNAESSLKDDETKDESETSETEEKEVEKKPKKQKGGFQRRINKLNSRLSAKEEEAAYWRAEALKAKSRSESSDSTSQAKPKNEGKPKADDFESHEDYVDALTDWKVEKKIFDYEEKKRGEAIKNEYASKAKTHAERVNSFVAKHSDFHEVLEEVSDVRLSGVVQELIIESDLGPDLMYHLAKDQDELERICALTPLAAAKAIGRLEIKLGGSKNENEKLNNKKISKAPNPPTPIRSKSEKSGKKTIFDDDLTQAEYEALRRKQRSR